jgi:catechol 2,3-dioxygenase-like lactoylglutathione lyase family enzyme
MAAGVLPLASLNHISIVCRSVEASLRFYADVLGFVPIRRPGSFDFDGAWCVRGRLLNRVYQLHACSALPSFFHLPSLIYNTI